MAGDIMNSKVGLRDVIIAVAFFVSVGVGYGVTKSGQDKVNAVNDIRIQYLTIKVEKLELDLEKLKEKTQK